MAGTTYTSVTLVPPANFEGGLIFNQGAMVGPNGSGQYVLTGVDNATVQAYLGQGWTIAAFTL